MGGGEGRTALITGASSGIGAAFARQLAAQGYDLTLVARRENRLAALSAELQSRHGVTAGYLVADLAHPDGVGKVQEHIARYGAPYLLVNNAGFGATGAFSQADLERQVAMIQLHVVASVRLARAALPGMIARGTGAIINVASVLAFVPLAGDATYCATKSYLVAFTEALQAELRGTGVRVQALCPGLTRTEFHHPEHLPRFGRYQVPAALWSTADQVAAASLEALARGQRICIPGWRNRAVVALARLGVAGLVLRMIPPRF